MSARAFPHVPKSSKTLEVGDFWAIPLESGRFACGRVMGRWPAAYKGAKKGFLAALLDWTGSEHPTFESIAGAKVLIEGGSHIKAILEFGGQILGNRPLELDGLEPALYIEYPDNKIAQLWRGMEVLRPATNKETRRLKTLSIFGFAFLHSYANHHLT